MNSLTVTLLCQLGWIILVSSRNDTVNINQLEGYCDLLESIDNSRRIEIAPKIYKGPNILWFSLTKYFLCYSTINVTNMSFTSKGYNYTEFDKVWSNMKAYPVKCGIGLIFETLECLQHRQTYLCNVQLDNGTILYAPTMSTSLAGIAPAIHVFEVSENRILLHTQVNVTCIVSGIPSDSPVLFKKLGEKNDLDLHISNGGTKYILFDKTITRNGDISRTFTILDYSFNDDGIYTCYLNVTGCEITEARINVNGYRGPVITLPSKTSSETTYMGSDVNLTCYYYLTFFNSTIFNSTINDELIVHFFKKNLTNNDTNNDSMESVDEIKGKYTYHEPTYENGRFSRTLSIYNVQSSDATEYTCKVKYEREIVSATYTLSTIEVQENAKLGGTGDDSSELFYVIGIVAAILLSFCLFLFFFFFYRSKKSALKQGKRDLNIDLKRDQRESIPIDNINLAKDNYFASEKTVQDNHLSNAINGPSSHQYDVFICYSSLDRDWVKNTLLKELESRGIKACIDYRDFLVGAYIVENIIDAIYGSRKTIAVLSPDFMNSVYCKHELQTALLRKANHQVIPLLYKTCEVPDVLKDKTYLDWCHADVQPYIWDLLVKAIMVEA